MSRMRIGLVSREYPPFFGGGIGTYAREAAHALTEAGARVHVITEAHDETEPRCLSKGRLTVHRLPVYSRSWTWAAGFLRFGAEAGRLVAELAARGEIDVVEFAECGAAGAALAALRMGGARAVGGDALGPEGLVAEIAGATERAAPLGVAMVTHLHTPTEQLFALRSLGQREMDGALAAQTLGEQLALRGADLVCAPSHFIADWAHRRYQLPDRPIVIPYPMRVPERVEGGAMKRRVLYAGRIEPRKGVETLLRAWMMAARSHPGWTLRLAGADTTTGAGETSCWKALCGAIPEMDASVQYLGPLTPEELRREQARAAVCVIPSLWENFPNTCIEAMAAGRAVVVSHRGGMAEMIGDTEAGLVARAGDAESLARALGEILSEDLDRLAERGRIGRERILAMCDPSTIAARRLAMYRKAVARAARRRERGDEVLERLRWWRQAQAAGTGRLEALEIPAFEEATTRWLMEEEAACESR